MKINGKNRLLGFWGERKAANYLKKNGYKIVARNYKCPFGEVDIIARTEDTVVFAEVKTRNTDTFGQPNEAVDQTRRARYKNCVRYYFTGKEINCTVRFDVIEVDGKGGVGRINHIPNAF